MLDQSVDVEFTLGVGEWNGLGGSDRYKYGEEQSPLSEECCCGKKHGQNEWYGGESRSKEWR